MLQKLFGATRLAEKPESASGLRVILVIGGLALPAGKAWTTPCFPRSRASPLPSKVRVVEVGVEFGEDLGDEDRSSDVAGALSVIAMAVGLPPTCTAPRGSGSADCS